MPRKLFSSTFGSIAFDSGIIPLGQPAAPAPGALIGYQTGVEPYAMDKHDDRIYLDAAGLVEIQGGTTFMTYDFHDLRDLLEEGECLADAMIGIQRFKETPEIIECFNVAPGRNIRETIIVTNADVDCNDGRLSALPGLNLLFKAGFQPLQGNFNDNKLGSLRELLYCERRVYAQDQSQTYSSPNAMGSMQGAPGATVTPTRWLNNWLMIDRTVTGEADLVIGPTLMVMRLIEVLPANRDSQQRTTFPGNVPPLEAGEFLNNESRVFVSFTGFTLSIVGNKRKLTETEKAIEYSNVFLSNQNDVPSP
jgi:hypothetical protein